MGIIAITPPTLPALLQQVDSAAAEFGRAEQDIKDGIAHNAAWRFGNCQDMVWTAGEMARGLSNLAGGTANQHTLGSAQGVCQALQSTMRECQGLSEDGGDNLVMAMRRARGRLALLKEHVREAMDAAGLEYHGPRPSDSIHRDADGLAMGPAADPHNAGDKARPPAAPDPSRCEKTGLPVWDCRCWQG